MINSNLCEKLFSSSELPIIFDGNLKTTSVPISVAYFNLLCYEFDSFIFKLSYWVTLYWYYIM